MSDAKVTCPDCDIAAAAMDRRYFLKATGTGALAAVAAGSMPRMLAGAPAPSSSKVPETVVKLLYDSFSDDQRKVVCFDWDYTEPGERGLLRTRVANNWNITEPAIVDDFYTDEQRRLVRDIFEGMVKPEWHAKFDKQLEDDAGGFGNEQSLAIFGKPGSDKFEFVMTGRHMTMRCDGNSVDHVAFGGPIFYGHAPDFNESAKHEGNVFWHQAQAANEVFQMLDGKQRKQALIAKSPQESHVGFQGAEGTFPGIPVSELASDQKENVQKVLKLLLEPYRQSDQDEVVACLKAQGGLEKCSLAFYQDNDIGGDEVWDNWRLEGPSFVWYFRGSPHVHVWVNVANDSSVKLNA
jgi:hypothetical protein